MSERTVNNFGIQALAAERMQEEFLKRYLADLDARGIRYTMILDELIIEGVDPALPD